VGIRRERIAECRAIQKRVIRELEAALGVDVAYPATLKALECIAALEKLDNEIVEAA
jgi:hypothetical protein